MADSEAPVLGPGYTRRAASTLTPTQQAARTAILAGDRPQDYESVPCPCGASRGDRLLSEVDRHGLPCRNVICLGCGLVRLDPRWKEERYRRFYEMEYRALYNPSPKPKASYAGQVAGSDATGERARWVVAAAGSLRVWTPKVVEIGAGGGWNLARLPAAWPRVGFDVDDEFLRIGAATFGLDMRRGFVEEALDEVAQADIVLLSHVVEHFSEPREVLSTIARRLRPEARLLIEVPGLFRLHRTNLDVRTYLQNAHTFTYCGFTLRDVCLRAGLEVLEVDEVARAVCRRGSAVPGSPAPARPGVAARVIRYLRLCDAGFRWYRRLRRVPGIGPVAAYTWRRTYFASLAALVPRRG